jgi:NarL family two-component system response regulator LiaR
VNTPEPLRIAIVNDYELVVQGLVRMFEPFAHRIRVVEAVANAAVREPVDVVLFDTFARTRELDTVLADANGRRLAVYSWSLAPDKIKDALRRGASGYLAKNLTSDELVGALERIHRGETVITEEPSTAGSEGTDWPGRDSGLTAREAEIIALITQGLSNQDIADRAFLSINTIKSYIRSSYRKMDVETRSQAVLWGIDHGFRPDHVRLREPLAQD